MSGYPKVLQDLIEALSFLPGIGRRSAERIALYILEEKKERVDMLVNLIQSVKDEIRPCRLCNNFSTEDICSICQDEKRDRSLVCVVEYPKDIMAIEKTGAYRGLYYVLLGAISPLKGKGVDSLDIDNLRKRAEEGELKEVIIATDSDAEGEITATFIRDSLKQYNLKISRIGIGIPLGSQIEYADSATLEKALAGRIPLT
ncbi:MAG: recombination protein RecR [Candidatus Omnitrophica bacterium]|nr:recombination protein RecR [Candidatus Omnitrophota bacterium]